METEAYTWRGEKEKGTDGMAQRAIGDRVQQQREKHRFSTTVMEVLQLQIFEGRKYYDI